jgi:hypothetical protein
VSGLWRRRVAVGVLGAALALGCGGPTDQPPPNVETPDPGGSGDTDSDSHNGGTDGGTGGTPDGGTGGTPDGGTGGTPDGGTGGTPDGGTGATPDGGSGGGGGQDVTVTFPTAEGWRFLGPQHGGPRDVFGVTEDQGGNIWVAGGEEGLFLLRPGRDTFERFTMEDGLRPYGYMPDGSDPTGSWRYLKVISVAGGPAGSVFVGYEGHPGCENNYGTAGADPSIYKSGDADRVTLTSGGIKVVHYDIFSGPGVVAGYDAREKLCHIYRIAYDATTNSVWFSGNHGVARGDADFAGAPTCNGQLRCSGVEEHAHPHIGARDSAGKTVILTDLYYGLAPAADGDVWIGGANRSARFRYMSNDRKPRDFWRAQALIEDAQYVENRLDIWKDAVGEQGYPRPEDRTDDLVSGMAAMPDGTVWVSSFSHGLAHLDASGQVTRYALSAKADRNLSALARDTRDNSIWAGHKFGGGVTRLKGDTLMRYWTALGAMGEHPVLDIQAGGSGTGRRMLVAFGRHGERPGAIGIYTGE